MALSILQGRMDHDWTSYQLYSAGKDIGVMVEVVYRTLRKDDIGDAASNIDEQYSKLVITSKDQLAISGKDLLEWFKKPGGPWVKEWLSKAEEAVLNREIANDQSSIRRWIDNCQHPSENN